MSRKQTADMKYQTLLALEILGDDALLLPVKVISCDLHVKC